MQEADLEDVIEEMNLADLGEEVEAMRAVLRRNIEGFRGLCKTEGEEFHIKVPPNFDMSQLDCPQHRRSEKERVLEEAKVTLMTLGVLEPSDALASTNFVFVAKKTKDAAGKQEQRTVTGHRKINQFTEQDGYPMPPLEDIVNFLSLHRFFSTLDLRHGYWAMPTVKLSRKFTAVKTALGIVQYARMSMGLKNASTFFQRMIENILRRFLWQVCLAYQDDVNVGTATSKEHVTAVEDVLQTLLAKGLKLKISKCKIGKTSIETLGFRVSYHAIQPSDEHVQQLAAFPTPCCGQSLLQFLGFVSFFGRWIEGCADRTAPLYEVFRDTPWNRKKSKRAPVRVPEFEARRT